MRLVFCLGAESGNETSVLPGAVFRLRTTRWMEGLSTASSTESCPMASTSPTSPLCLG